MVIILFIVIAFPRIYVLLPLVCDVKVGQARARAAQGIDVRFSQEWQPFKCCMEGGVNCIFIGFLHTVIFREFK